MLFNSLSFLVFFPIVFILYYSLAPKFRKGLLLLASCYFYMCFVPEYILILLALIAIDFFLAQKIQIAEAAMRRWYLVLSVSSSLGILFLFKYFNFFNESVSDIAALINWNYSPLLLSIALPLGLSFHVFQSLSYVIEVYRKKYVAERNFFTYALYVLFFPQLVAGPIERPQNLLPQLNTTQEFNSENVRKGLEQMLWGFFKKVVIADQIAQIIDPFYANLPTESSLLIVIAILFSYQLYCDFSGYSDIAIGSAKMLGYNLSPNFNRPFAARSLADFWRRWHISLSSWLKDYLYYPLVLGFGKKTKIKVYMSLFVTFMLIGLWHGANWTFVIFGALHGIYLVLELMTEKIRQSATKVLGNTLQHFLETGVIFSFVSISFIFFRSETVTQAWWFVSHMFSAPSIEFITNGLLRTLTSHVGTVIFAVVIMACILMEVVQYYQSKKDTLFIFDTFPKTVRYGWYYLLTSMILLFGYFGGESFIYFQF